MDGRTISNIVLYRGMVRWDYIVVPGDSWVSCTFNCTAAVCDSKLARLRFRPADKSVDKLFKFNGSVGQTHLAGSKNRFKLTNECRRGMLHKTVSVRCVRLSYKSVTYGEPLENTESLQRTHYSSSAKLKFTCCKQCDSFTTHTLRKCTLEITKDRNCINYNYKCELKDSNLSNC
jgi:hypothetical protein